MNKLLCHYAIVRFSPYTETGEFANVGVVLLCPETGYFDYRMMVRVRRVTSFFEELDPTYYLRARNEFRQELKRLKDFIAPQGLPMRFGKELVRNIFNELIRPREVMMRFDEPRTILVDDPAEELDTLFAHYVERDFATKAYQEKQLEQKLRNVLRTADLSKKFVPKTLGNETYHARFPFVYFEDGLPQKAIKPLHLAHDDPKQIYDHGWAWLGTVHKLQHLNMIPDELLFTVQIPTTQGERYDTYLEMKELLVKAGSKVVDATHTNEILEFAF